MSNSSINEILWTKHELMSASKGKDLTTKFLNNKNSTFIFFASYQRFNDGWLNLDNKYEYYFDLILNV